MSFFGMVGEFGLGMDTVGGDETAAATTQSGSSAGVATVTATLAATRPVTGTAAGRSTVAGSLGATRTLTGTSAGRATATASAQVTRMLTATSRGVAVVTAAVQVVPNGSLSGTAQGRATVTAKLTSRLALSSTSNGVATVSTSVRVTRVLVVQVAQGRAVVTGTATLVPVTRVLVGTSQGVAVLAMPSLNVQSVFVRPAVPAQAMTVLSGEGSFFE